MQQDEPPVIQITKSVRRSKLFVFIVLFVLGNKQIVMAQSNSIMNSVVEVTVQELEMGEATIQEIGEEEELAYPYADLGTQQLVEEEEETNQYFEGDEQPDFFEKVDATEYTQEDVMCFAHLIHAEAGICSELEKYRVGTVVMNRVKDTKFANTVQGVIYESGQFTSVGSRAWNEQPTEREIQIAINCLEGVRVYPSNVVWFSKKQQYGELIDKSDWHEYSGWSTGETTQEETTETEAEEENSSSVSRYKSNIKLYEEKDKRNFEIK